MKKYKQQTYLVKFDTLTPVNISVTIEHYDTHELTRSEIVNESLGYLEDFNILGFYESDIFEIEIITLEV